MYKAIRDEGAFLIRQNIHDMKSNDIMGLILSIRLNDKGEPDPEGRYAVKVVDLKAGLPETNDTRWGVEVQQDMLKAGFVKEIKEATDGR